MPSQTTYPPSSREKAVLGYIVRGNPYCNTPFSMCPRYASVEFWVRNGSPKSTYCVFQNRPAEMCDSRAELPRTGIWVPRCRWRHPVRFPLAAPHTMNATQGNVFLDFFDGPAREVYEASREEPGQKCIGTAMVTQVAELLQHQIMCWLPEASPQRYSR